MRSSAPVSRSRTWRATSRATASIPPRVDACRTARDFVLRPYQRAAAQAFYQDGDQRGGNGVVVLPCGAGKTITAMAAMQLYQTKTLVLTNSTTAVRQWVRELKEKTDLPETDDRRVQRRGEGDRAGHGLDLPDDHLPFVA